METEVFKPGIFSLVAVIMFVMAATSFGYLLRVRNKTRASQMLLWFFLCVMLSSVATFLTNLETQWAWAFAPSQDAFLILGGLFLTHFAYSYPNPEGSVESRWVTRIVAGIAALALAYSLFYAYQYLSSLPTEVDEIRAYYLLTPITMFGIVLILFRRSLTLSKQDQVVKHAILPSLIKPHSTAASGLRNLGVALSVGLIPAIVFLIKPALPELIASFLFNFGVVVAISAIMLVYLNYSPEPTTITAKLVGISLVTILLLLGATCISILTYYPSLETHRIVSIFIPAVLISSVFVLLVFPIFFRVTFFEPLARLLEGVRAADEGKLGYQVEVKFKDELGFLTRSFNRMIHSIRELTQQQENRAEDLEMEVVKRTEELRQINQELLEENEQRERTRKRLDQQLLYERALAGCSQTLLSGEGELEKLQGVLTAALEVLRSAADASRAYVAQRYDDAEGVERVRLFAEVCAPGVSQRIANPANQVFPVSDFPREYVQTLESGKPIIGRTEKVFAGHPLGELYLQQDPPLLSMLHFPIHLDQQWWGFVGFDDCESPREWGESEILFLRTASEMMRSAIHRWEIRAQLMDTLADLEQRVEDRTQLLNNANIQLQEEVSERRKFQSNLERRLKNKRLLAKASAHLAEAQDISTVFEDMLRDLGEMMEAGSLTMVILDPENPASSPQIFNWHLPSRKSVDRQFVEMLLEPTGVFYPQFGTGKPLLFREIDQFPSDSQVFLDTCAAEEVDTLILWPLVSNSEFMGLLLFCCSALDDTSIADNLQSLEMFVGLLSGMLERERILHTLETRVTQQTRELSTLYEMTMLTSNSHRISELLSPALSKIQEISKSEAACIHLYRPEEESLVLTAHRGLSPEISSDLERISIQGKFIHWLERPEPDHTLNRNLPDDIPDQFCFPGFQAMMMSKLRAAGTTQGLVSCFRASEEPFTVFQTSMLAVIGELLGVVVENHRLARETEKLATIQERQRLARDLHDAVSQSLYSLSLFARSARDAHESGEEVKLTDSLEQLEINSLAALKEMRLLLYQLRSIALEEGDLQQAIKSRMDMVEHRLGINAAVEIDEQIELDAGLEQEFFRIITEALNNSLHYADANQVSITLSLSNGQILLAIEDDGVGFDPSRVREGMGLQNMRERLLAYDGNLEIISQPGRGTRLEIFVPEDYKIMGADLNE